MRKPNIIIDQKKQQVLITGVIEVVIPVNLNCRGKTGGIFSPFNSLL
jgi:hypothetical protein